MVRETIDGRYIVNGTILSGADAREIFVHFEQKYKEEDLQNVLSQMYGENEADKIFADKNLVNSILDSYQDKREDDDTWRYNMESSIKEYKTQIEEIINNEE